MLFLLLSRAKAGLGLCSVSTPRSVLICATPSVLADAPLAPTVYRVRLASHGQLVHLSLAVNRCIGASG